MTKPAPPVPTSPAETALIGVKRARKANILVVDDEKTNVELLTRYLNREGYAVTTAFNGEEALAQIKITAPDVLLLDVHMPVLDGLSVCHALRAEFATKSLPIILLTARNTLEDRLLGFRAGADDYIGKPYDLEEVKARLEGTLQRRQWDQATHPLTRLPGSPAIEDEVWKRLRLGSPFAFAYIDIDNFKAFNDEYGYEAGDKVIKCLASILVDAAKETAHGSSFAGHVGGDDFVLISAVEQMQALMPAIGSDFDNARKLFYRAHDLERGSIQTKNRQGVTQIFPLMTLSVAVVSTLTRRILHYARLAEIASELKHFVKTKPHEGRSLVMWDRRKDPEFEGPLHE